MSNLNSKKTFEINGISDVDYYFADRIVEAAKTRTDKEQWEICSLTWQDDQEDRLGINLNEQDADAQNRQNRMFEGIRNCFEKNENVRFREVFTFSYGVRKEIMEKRLDIGKVYQDRYECCYYDNLAKLKKERFPKLQFRIIGNEEVIFASRGYGTHLCAIKDPDLVFIMRKYFDMAWNNAHRISPPPEGKTTAEVLDKIEKDIQKYLNPQNSDKSKGLGHLLRRLKPITIKINAGGLAIHFGD